MLNTTPIGYTAVIAVIIPYKSISVKQKFASSPQYIQTAFAFTKTCVSELPNTLIYISLKIHLQFKSAIAG